MPRPLSTITIALGIATAAALLYAWHLHAELIEAQARLAVRSAELARVQKQAADLALNPLLPGAPAPFPVAPSFAPGPTPSASTPPARPPGAPSFAAIHDSPERQRLTAIQRRAALDGRYAALFRKLNLNPADLEKLKGLLVEKQSAPADVFSAARAEGLNPRENREQIGQLVAKYEAEADASIRETLGESVFQQYQQYEQTLPQRNVANQLEQRLSYSSTPLDNSQTEQLIRVLSVTSTAAPDKVMAAALPPGINLRANPPITDATIAQSRAFLSAPQLEALRQLQQEQSVQAQLRQQMPQPRRNGADGGTPPPTGPSGP